MRRLQPESLTPWIEIRFDRASGPGGQHVNKVSTRATLLFDFRACALLSHAEQARLAQRCATRLARDGRLRLVCQSARTQAANRALAEQRLVELLTNALHVPTPRRPTAPTRGSQRRRLDAKRQRSQLKHIRQKRPGVGD